MRFRTSLVALTALAVSGVFSAVPALARAQPSARLADAPVAHVVYVSGSLMNAAGHPSLLAGVASINVDSSGAYSGTLTTAGTKPATLQVTGTYTTTGMTLMTTWNGQALSVQAAPVVEPIGARGASTPSTTSGAEFRGAVMSGSSTVGYVTAFDASILREYSFAASITRGPDRGTAINGGLFLMVDAYGDLRGYLKRDDNSQIFPISGALGRGQMLLHVNMLTNGQVLGAATVSRSIIATLTVYRGRLAGPRNNDQGTWLSSPPES